MTRRHGLSKSKIAAFEQCPKRLWLATHRPELSEADPDAPQFAIGHAVGAEACRQCTGGVMVEAEPNLGAAIATTRALIDGGHKAPIFEATFEHDGVLVRIDVLEPCDGGWRIAEVKSSTSAKPQHVGDLATQVWVAEKAGINVTAATIRHLHKGFVLEREGDYDGLFADTDLRAAIAPVVAGRAAVVAQARAVLAGDEPDTPVGDHCDDPYPCEFAGYCHADLPAGPEWPVTILPNGGGKQFLKQGVDDLTAIDPATLRTEVHRRVHRATVTGLPVQDVEGAAQAMAGWAYPRIWLDFETVNEAIPRWIGCSPYMQTPFQFVAQVEAEGGGIEHIDFLHLDGSDPRRACAEALAALPREGAVIAWFATFERSRIVELAARFPDLAPALQSLVGRIVDLLPVARAHWYHRDQRGSWSIKAVLPTIAPELDYAGLDVKDGADAVEAYREATAPGTTPERRAALDAALRAYCGRDVEAMRVVARGLVKLREVQ